MGVALGYVAPAKPSRYSIPFVTEAATENIAAVVPTDTTELTVAVTMPTLVSITKVLVVAIITAMNNSTNPQKISIQLKARKGSGAWTTKFDQTNVIGMGAIEGDTRGIPIVADVSAIVTEDATYGFKCTMTDTSVGAVRFTTQYLVVIYFEPT